MLNCTHSKEIDKSAERVDKTIAWERKVVPLGDIFTELATVVLNRIDIN